MEAFVAWWSRNVTVRQSSGNNQWSSADRRTTISLDKAEELTGITNQQVSKWRR